MERRDTFEIQVTFQSELLQLSKSIIIQYDARTKHQRREVGKGEEKVQCSMHFNKFLSSDSPTEKYHVARNVRVRPSKE